MADSSGHFLVEARIKGRVVSAMVDTGATTVALSEATARRLGIFPARAAFNRQVATANGIVEAASVTLPDVRVGNIVVRNVEALVIPGESLGIDLPVRQQKLAEMLGGVVRFNRDDFPFTEAKDLG